MHPEVTADYSWSRRFLPVIKPILGQHLIAEAPPEEDMKHNTDLMVLGFDAVRIGCRVRRLEWLRQYGDEFTIRSDRPRGTETELAKVRAGWGDYFFYGFGGDDEQLHAYLLGDLDVFRFWFEDELTTTGRMPGVEKANWDGSAKFRAFQIGDLPENFLLTRLEAAKTATALKKEAKAKAIKAVEQFTLFDEP